MHDGARTSLARESDRVGELLRRGIDSPLKLDLLVSLEQAGGGFVDPQSLALACSASEREAVGALESLERSGFVRSRRFYNIVEWGTEAAAPARASLRALVGETPAETRRLRRALLARAYAS